MVEKDISSSDSWSFVLIVDFGSGNFDNNNFYGDEQKEDHKSGHVVSFLARDDSVIFQQQGRNDPADEGQHRGRVEAQAFVSVGLVWPWPDSLACGPSLAEFAKIM